MGIGAYTMAILVVKEDFNMWLAAGCGVVLAMLAGLLLGLPTLRLRADYFAITTIAFSEILALRRHERGQADRRLAGNDQPRRERQRVAVRRRSGRVPRHGGTQPPSPRTPRC